MDLNERIERKKNFFLNRSNISASVLFLTIFIFDRISKIKIVELLENKDLIIITDFLNFDLTFNTGIGFGLLSSQEGFYYHSISFLILAIIMFIFYLMYKSSSYEKICYSLILGGAAGNLYDRLIYLSVPDFIDFHFNSYHWFTFNIADIFITLGVILILIKEIVKKS